MKLSVKSIIPLGLCAALALSGCSSTSPESQSSEAAASSASDGSGGLCDVTVIEDAQSLDTSAEDLAGSEEALNQVTLSSDVAGAPTLTYKAPLPVTAESVLVTDEGDGDAISEGQVITFNYMVCDLVTGEKVFSTWGETPDADNPAAFVLSVANFGDALVDALDTQSVGTRLLWGQPGYSAEDSYSGTASNGYLYVLNIIGANAIPDSASGKEVTPSDASLPTIGFEGGVPAVEIPASFTEPTELIAEPLIEGDGKEVKAGDTIAVKYSGWLTSGTLFDSSWGEDGTGEPAVFQIGVSQVIAGWDDGLVGQKVGSRVLLVIPSDLAYGDSDSGPIPGGSTLIFVVDILAAF